VPLSEEELRLLEQMERALEAEDPKFVSAIQGRTLQRAARLRAAMAALVFLCGMALLLGGAMAQLVWLSIVGFVVMLASATIGLTAWRGHRGPREQVVPNDPFDRDDRSHRFQVIDGGKHDRRPGRQRRQRATGGFMHRMEQRWAKRHDQGF